MATEQQWKPFSLTHVTYPSHSHIVAPTLALLSLTPPFGVCALVTATIVYKDVLAAYLLVGSVSSTAVTSIIKKLVRESRPPRYDDVKEEVDYGMPSNHSCYVWFCAVFIVLYTLRGGGGGLRIGEVDHRTAVEASSTVARVTMSSSQSRSDTCGNGNDNGNGNGYAPASTITTTTTTTQSRSDTCGNGNGNGNGYAPASTITTTTTTTSRIISANTWHNLHASFAVIPSLLIAIGCSYSRIYLGYHTMPQVFVGSIVGCALGCIWYGLLETTDAVRNSLISMDATLRELERGRMQLRLAGLDDCNGRKND
eukprot:CAMPEP_0196158808 /NCGR_PEP_ID=MMETSP0910-20130528/45992_1 /TAXON_ID=49265 /ORGANISM="Thalassiosira rotula, Strain GSO102" /LENGTH=310 /DNA_ID=CAMNT_0041423719 /DNA_START=76 /DNA_END=1008 /DNA_ORIENTATION=-